MTTVQALEQHSLCVLVGHKFQSRIDLCDSGYAEYRCDLARFLLVMLLCLGEYHESATVLLCQSACRVCA